MLWGHVELSSFVPVPEAGPPPAAGSVNSVVRHWDFFSEGTCAAEGRAPRKGQGSWVCGALRGDKQEISLPQASFGKLRSKFIREKLPRGTWFLRWLILKPWGGTWGLLIPSVTLPRVGIYQPVWSSFRRWSRACIKTGCQRDRGEGCSFGRRWLWLPRW